MSYFNRGPMFEQDGLAGEVIRNGFAELNIFGSGRDSQGLIRVTFDGNWYKPETQWVRLEQVNKPNTVFFWQARFNNKGIEETIRRAQAAIPTLRTHLRSL